MKTNAQDLPGMQKAQKDLLRSLKEVSDLLNVTRLTLRKMTNFIQICHRRANSRFKSSLASSLVFSLKGLSSFVKIISEC